MTKNPVIYLEHNSVCIQKIEDYTKELTEETFLHNTLIQDAVIRNFEIIGEATKKLDTDFRSKHPEIEWKKIEGMRDKLIHDYIGVDLWAIWAVVENIMPILKDQIAVILNNENKGL